MESEILAVIIAAILGIAGWVIKTVFAQKSLVYAKHNSLEEQLNKSINEIKDVVKQSFDSANERMNKIETADKVCRVNMDGVSSSRMVAIEKDQTNFNESIKKMNEYTRKLDKDLIELKTDVQKLKEDINSVKSELVEHNAILHSMKDILTSIHGETFQKTKLIKQAVGHSKKSIHVSKEDFKKGKL